MNDDAKLDAQMPNSVLSHTSESSNRKPGGKLNRELEAFTGNLHAVSAVLDVTDECGPRLRPDGEAGTVRIL